MSKKLKSTLTNYRTYNSAEIESDHSLIIANLVMKKPKQTKHIAKKLLKRYDTDKLQSKETSKKCASIIGEGFNLLGEDDEMTPDEFYIKFKKIVHTAAEKEIGHKRHIEIPGLSSEVKDLCAQRRSAKIMMLQNQCNEEYTNNYRELNKRVKAEVKK